jgi:hypothetical protein
METYQLISSDSHIIEPADLWQEWIDRPFRDRAPRLVHGRRFTEGAMPSDFFHQNIFLSFQEDAVGIELRDLIGVDTLLWGSDYPHAESTFPRSREIVERILQGVPAVEKALIAGGNTARLYHFDAVH